MSVEIDYSDYSDLTLEQFNAAVLRGLEACGMTAETYAKQGCPVDTGRLRNSITHATKNNSGTTHTYKDDHGNTYTQDIGSVNELAAYIGSNVRYAEYQELGTANGVTAKHFLRNAAGNHAEEYKNIIKSSLENA
ncbi:HK97 gp10 family phage protein [Treponema sp.]|uniref:HK97 gp10 family phage protein n=1 Tax=Treponema sp. TaxID=166 RepID=UPI00388D7E78